MKKLICSFCLQLILYSSVFSLTSTASRAAEIYRDEAEVSSLVNGDAKRGKRIFNRCLRCHATETDKINRVGPTLKNILGRKVGTVKGYKYSAALKSADFIWNEKKLDEWLQKPRSFLPGNRMTFTGLGNQKDRLDLLAYLKKSDNNGK